MHGGHALGVGVEGQFHDLGTLAQKLGAIETGLGRGDQKRNFGRIAARMNFAIRAALQ